VVKISTMHADLYYLMKAALKEAEKGFAKGEVPIGAVLAGPDGQIVAKAHNQPISLNDPTAHAEILAMRKAGRLYENYRLNHTLLVATIEPCLMCMGAAINARIKQLVFGAPDPKAGAAGSLYNLVSDKRLNHRIEVISGIMEDECRALMQEFFQNRRKDPTDCAE
jgi:tRNA(adenine34) deaminase